MSENAERFFQNLKDIGLFTRDYDGVCFEKLPLAVRDMYKAVKELHTQVCHIGHPARLRDWLELPLGQLLEAWAKDTGWNTFESMDGLSWREDKEEACT